MLRVSCKVNVKPFACKQQRRCASSNSDQSLSFRSMESEHTDLASHLVPIFQQVSSTKQAGLSLTWLHPNKTGFS